MYGVNMSKKENRLKAREIMYLKEGETIVDMPEIEFVAYLGNEPPTITAFKGTAGKPYIYYRYRSVERRDEALQKAIDDQKKSLEYKAQRKEENKGKLTGSAATAKAIRERLKKEFPGVKFSVTSDNYSMGNSVHISWTDGPMYEQINSITKQYQYGHFDGMIDCYEYRDIKQELDCPGAKYVSCNRHMSDEYRAQLQEILERDFTPYHGPGSYAPFQYTEAEKQLLGITQEPEQQETLPEAQEPEKKPEPETSATSAKIIDFTARLQIKREQQEAEEAIKTFRTQYLPYVTLEDAQQVMEAPEAQQADIISRICLKIDLERGLK